MQVLISMTSKCVLGEQVHVMQGMQVSQEMQSCMVTCCHNVMGQTWLGRDLRSIGMRKTWCVRRCTCSMIWHVCGHRLWWSPATRACVNKCILAVPQPCGAMQVYAADAVGHCNEVSTLGCSCWQ